MRWQLHTAENLFRKLRSNKCDAGIRFHANVFIYIFGKFRLFGGYDFNRIENNKYILQENEVSRTRCLLLVTVHTK